MSAEVIKESSKGLAVRLLKSSQPEHIALKNKLKACFFEHINRLDEKVLRTEYVAISGDVPADAAYPRYFTEAHPELIAEIKQVLEGLALPLDRVDWPGCLNDLSYFWTSELWEKEGVGPDYEDPEKLRRGFSICKEIPDYSAFQLVCLFKQIQLGSIDPHLVEQLKIALNGRIISYKLAKQTGVTYEQFFEASKLLGNIDIVHTNHDTLYRLLKDEYASDFSEEILSRRVKMDIGLLGFATGHSRAEYDSIVSGFKKASGRPC